MFIEGKEGWQIGKTLACGCQVFYIVGGSYDVRYCPKHKAAPDMYEALKLVTERIDGFNYPVDFEYPFMRVKEALAKAEG